jgi:tellurite resistance protein TerA
MATDPSSRAILDATRSRAKFSGHGAAKGAAGLRMASYDPDNCDLLSEPGQAIALTPGQRGFEDITIGGAWDALPPPKAGFFQRLLGGAPKARGVDLDLGCLYELADGRRGAIQAFGKKFGRLDGAPWIQLSGDERTGKTDGHDEYLTICGHHWDKIARIVVYVYIYDGAARWSAVKPRVIVDVPGENDLVVTLSAHNDALPICAVGGLENVRGGIKLTNYTEYFPSHPAMDRAFGFGLNWSDGEKA